MWMTMPLLPGVYIYLNSLYLLWILAYLVLSIKDHELYLIEGHVKSFDKLFHSRCNVKDPSRDPISF